MRIIAGVARSLPLKTLPGMDTRPTTDRIKETLFNIISADIPGCSFLDLFAGSGQIGLEAISRGASSCVFVDNNKKACEVIQDNIDFTKFNDKSRIIFTDAINAIRQLEGNNCFDIIFADPPYALGIEPDLLMYLQKSSIINEDSIIIIEADLKTNFDFADSLGFEVYREKTYKTNKHVFLRKK